MIVTKMQEDGTTYLCDHKVGVDDDRYRAKDCEKIYRHQSNNSKNRYIKTIVKSNSKNKKKKQKSSELMYKRCYG